jgi:N-acyl-phosphatidylethanolamine-hydrolysing phospholipase D
LGVALEPPRADDSRDSWKLSPERRTRPLGAGVPESDRFFRIRSVIEGYVVGLVGVDRFPVEALLESRLGVEGRPDGRDDRRLTPPAASPPECPVLPVPATRVTYLGHASLLVETGGSILATDPVYGSRIGGFFTRRAIPSTFRPQELRGVVGILISHAHHDHLDYPSLAALSRSVPIVVPWGVAPPLRWRGHEDVRVLRRWQRTQLGSWAVTAVPSRHFGGRLPMVGTSGHQGYVLEGSVCIYFAGDTGFDPAMFRAIADRFRIDLAILPIAGAVVPWFRRNHMNAAEALSAFQLLRATQMLPMHFETFPASFEPVGQPRRQLMEGSERLGLTASVKLLAPGASLWLP